MAYASPIKKPDDKADPSYIRQRTPNPKLPWCTTCKRHTDYHLKVIGRDPKTGGDKTAAFDTCDECGGDTWKPTYPLAINIVSLLFCGFLLFMCTYALLAGWIEEEPDSVIMLLVLPFVAYKLYKNSKKNSAHWRTFRAWAKSENSL